MTPSADQIREVIAQQAGAWFVANQAGPLDEADRAGFVAWLQTSPIHVEEYLGVALVARDLPAAADDPAVPLESLLTQALADEATNVVRFDEANPADSLPRRYRVSRTWLFAASAATAAVFFLATSLAWWARDGEFLGLPRTYRTAHGEQLAQRLPDGTWLHLNTDSAVTVRYSRAERVVDVERGQAMVQVAQDSKRRFRAAVGDAQVVALGTQFDVYRKLDNDAVITVIEGSVGIVIGEPRPPRTDTALPSYALRATAGQQVRLEAGVMPTEAVAVNLQEVVAWRKRQIVFENRPLGEVADEFNRYAQIPIEIDDPALRALAVSGVFDAYDTDSFARFLETLDGVAVQRTEARIRVFHSSQSSAPGQ
jgi:transmembrane sensor